MRQFFSRAENTGGGGKDRPDDTPRNAMEAAQAAALAGLRIAGEMFDPNNLKNLRLKEMIPDLKPSDLLKRSTWLTWMQSREFPFPLVRDLCQYRAETAKADFWAAVTVMLVSIPQAMGFALLADLPSSMVLKTVIVGSIVAALFMSSRHVVFGATNSISLFLAISIHGQMGQSALSPEHLAVLIALMMGLIQLCCGLLRFGQLTQYVSRSVVLGYSTGIGILLMIGQVGNFMGVPRSSGDTLWVGLWNAVQSVRSLGVNWNAVCLSLASLLGILLLRRLRPTWPGALIVLLAATAVTFAWELDRHGVRILRDQGQIAPGIPKLEGVPQILEELRFFGSIASIALALAVLGMLEAVSISKTLASKSGQRINSNQELTGMGLGNLACALFAAMPGSASFARSSANQQAGARTQMATVMSSLMILFGLLFFTPVLEFLPIPALAAYLIWLGFQIINWEQIFIAIRSTRSDTTVFFVTLAGALFLPLDTAIYAGIGVSLALYLSKAAMPSLAEYAFNDTGNLQQVDERFGRANEQISIIHVEGELFFGAADLFQDEIRRIAENQGIRVFILRMKNARHLDATSVFALRGLLDYLRETGRHLLISGAGPDVMRVLANSRLLDRIGHDNVFPAEANPTLATKRALLRACSLLGIRSSSFRIFYDKSKETTSGTLPVGFADALPDHWEI
jgi:SulP family sulfate permease